MPIRIFNPILAFRQKEVNMAYEEAKVYYDGSHYIAIPHTIRKVKRRPKMAEEEIIVKDKKLVERPEDNAGWRLGESDDYGIEIRVNETSEPECNERVETEEFERPTTKKEYFDELYAENFNMSKRERTEAIFDKMRPLFNSDEDCRLYVELGVARKARNLTARRVRMFRKSNLQDFNYFCTFTYDNAKHSEQSFRKELGVCLSRFSSRKEWKYIGAWERSPENNRLHFHAIMDIPEGTMPGILCEVNDYSFNTKRRQITKQNSYFNERFGRTDFEEIDDKDKVSNAIFYLLKYIDKSGEKLVYSKGLPQFFICDIMNHDVVCMTGLEDKKLLLFDDFGCWDKGEYIGKVSKETIARLRKEV